MYIYRYAHRYTDAVYHTRKRTPVSVSQKEEGSHVNTAGNQSHAHLSLGSACEPKPVFVWSLIARSQHLDRVTILHLVFQGHHAAVDLAADTAVAEFGVHAVSEVNERGALGQGIQVPLGENTKTSFSNRSP